MKPHVLVIDDSLTVRMDLRAVLNTAGFAVTACDTKAAGQKALRSRSYALVILDVILPDGSGIDLLRELRSQQDSVHMPVILLSTEAEVRDRIRGLTTGADEYVGKPYDSAYVAKCARELVRAHELSPVSHVSSIFGGKKLLVVDDSPTYRNMLADLLRQDGHDIVLARSGEEALDLLSVEHPDGIVLDLLMPGIGGLETCRRIRANPAQQHIPVMMLTGRDDQSARAEGLAAGVDEFVIKSPELEVLKMRVRSMLKKRRTEQVARDVEEVMATTSAGRAPSPSEPPPSLDSLFARVVSASGLSNVIGPSTIGRACKRVGVDAKTMSPSDLQRALPAIRDTLGMFFTPEETHRRIEALALLASSAAHGAHPAHPTSKSVRTP
jgi:DNA-binding response OmpR family regulator